MSDVPQSPEFGEDYPKTSDAGSEQTTSRETKQTHDWRVIAILLLAGLLLLAVVINKKYYPKEEQTPVSSVQPVESSPAPDTPKPPTLTPEEQYARLINNRELQVVETMFTAHDKTFLVARRAAPVRSEDDPKRFIGLRPGELIDVSECLDGITPKMLHRRSLPGRSEIAYVDMFPPLGVRDGVAMVTKGAEEITVADVSDKELVIGVAINGQARAYPVRFASYHEVINDTLADTPIAVTWTALANAASAMERRDEAGTEIEFGAAWLMYQDAIVAYDVETGSLWAPLQRQCIVGERMGTTLKPVPAVLTPWSAWKRLHPETTVLVATDPILSINYGLNPSLPSGDYWRRPGILYPVYGFDVANSPLPVKTYVHGVTGPDGKSWKAYESLALRNNEASSFEDTIGGQKVLINYDNEARLLTAVDAGQSPLLVETMIWMCWSGLHPDTEVWQEEELRHAYEREPSPTDVEPDSSTEVPEEGPES